MGITHIKLLIDPLLHLGKHTRLSGDFSSYDLTLAGLKWLWERNDSLFVIFEHYYNHSKILLSIILTDKKCKFQLTCRWRGFLQWRSTEIEEEIRVCSLHHLMIGVKDLRIYIYYIILHYIKLSTVFPRLVPARRLVPALD